MAATPSQLYERIQKARRDSEIVEDRLREELEKLKKTCADLQEQTAQKRYKNGNGH